MLDPTPFWHPPPPKSGCLTQNEKNQTMQGAQLNMQAYQILEFCTILFSHL